MREVGVDGSVSSLRAQFGGKLPDPVEALAPPDAADLAESLRTALSRQRTELNESTEASLHQLPKVLRGLIRRALGL